MNELEKQAVRAQAAAELAEKAFQARAMVQFFFEGLVADPGKFRRVGDDQSIVEGQAINVMGECILEKMCELESALYGLADDLKPE